MSNYRRSLIPGGTFFFTVALADRHSSTLVDHIDHLRSVYSKVQRKRPFQTVAICILPEHLHAIWTMPPDDADYPLRWNLIKAGFSRALPPAEFRCASKEGKREKGIWQRRYWEHQIRDETDLRQACGLHSRQSAQTRAGKTCEGLAPFEFPSFCRPWRLACRLGGYEHG